MPLNTFLCAHFLHIASIFPSLAHFPDPIVISSYAPLGPFRHVSFSPFFSTFFHCFLVSFGETFPSFLIVEFLQHFLLILFYTSFLLSFRCVCPYILPNLLFPAVSFYTSFMYVTFLSFMHHFLLPSFLVYFFVYLLLSICPCGFLPCLFLYARLIPPSLFLHPFIAHDFLT